MMPKVKPSALIEVPHKGKGVLQINNKGSMPFDNIHQAALAMGVGWATMREWIGDGREHMGYRWEVER